MDGIVIVCICISLIFTIGFMFFDHWGIEPAHTSPTYMNKLFDNQRVHTIDIELDNPESFLIRQQIKTIMSVP